MEKVYKAKYQPKIFTTIYGGIFVGIFMLATYFSGLFEGNEPLFFALLGFSTLFFLPTLISEIRFGDDSLLVVYLFFRKRECLYSEIVDLGSNVIVTRNGKINLYGLRNSDELFRILNNLINSGRIKNDQITYEISFWESLSRRAYIPAFLISYIIWLIIVSIFQFEDLWLRRVGILLIFIPLYIAIVIQLRNRT